jgi:tetratricopeptide (TPR) repeat protein
MMNSTKKRILCGVLALFALVSVPKLSAQGIDVAWANSLTAMRADKWAEAHQILSKAVAQFDGRGMQLFGPKFGWFWYHKGFCELKLKKWEAAMESFKKCYTKYPNKNAGGAGLNPAAQGSFNFYHKKSLLKWGDAAIGAQEWETAIRQYKKFLQERDPKRDDYQRGAFYINMSMAHFKLTQIPAGIENLETAITNKEKFPTPDAGIMVGFQALVEAVIEKTNEQALIDFLNKNRSDIKLEPFQMHQFAPVFMKLAADALAAEMDRSAFELYALVPSTQAAIDDIKARLLQIGSIDRRFADPPRSNRQIHKEVLDADLEELKKQLRSGDPHEVIATAATAYIHENNKNVRGAFAAYEQLELYFNKAKKREEYLYNLVRTSAIIGEVLVTEKYGSLFLKTFPGSKHEESVRSMMLTSLFMEGEYEKCIEVALIMLPKLGSPSKQHDICLHVLGGSYYYTGKYDEARKYLDEHVELYEKSQFRMASLYFQASNLSRLQYWTAAAELLDEFLSNFPDPRENIYLPFALYDRANCHFAEDELDPSLVKLNRIESEFPNTDIMDMAYNLKGNVLQTQGEWDPAEKYYKMALELSKRRENRVVSGESLFYLVGLLGSEKRDRKENPRVKDAVPHYDEFWQEHGSDSPYKAQVAVAGVHPLTVVGRAEEALERLQGVISELATVQGAFGLEEAINSYTRAYLKQHSEKELKEHYYNFPGINSQNREAQALLRIALITVFEEKAKKANKDKDPNEKRLANSMIKVLFDDLKTEFQPAQLTNYVLVRLGDYLRERTGTPRNALPYYEEVVKREDLSYRFNAHFGIADILGGGASLADKQKAIDSLEHVIRNAPQRKQKERGLYRIVTIFAEKGDWKDVTIRAKQYLTTEGYRNYAGFVSLLLSQSYDKQGMREDAIASYSKTMGAFTGQIAVSAPAVTRIMELTWARKNGNDPQMAYEVGYKYSKSTKRLYHQMEDAEKKLWDAVGKLVQQYEDHSSVEKIVEEDEDA